MSKYILKDGTIATIEEARKQRKPCLVIDLLAAKDKNARNITEWINEFNIEVLNVAGPREKNSEGINKLSLDLLAIVFPQVKYSPSVRCRL